MRKKAVFYAIMAAVFYAISTPLSKLFLETVPASMMAAFLYLGAGVGVGILYLFRHKKEDRRERLTVTDLPAVVGMILLDIAAPVLMMYGIAQGSASNASLLGNFEIVATALIALLLFREKVSGKLWIAIGLITASGMLLSLEGEGSFRFSVGSLLVILATVCWGFENNCTRKISGKSTYEIVTVKGIFSGLGALALAVAVGEKMPPVPYILGVAALGFVAYGLSIFTYIRAQKDLGAAKTGAFYAIAPFVGVLLSVVLVGEKIGIRFLAALGVMIAGTVFAIWDTVSGERTP